MNGIPVEGLRKVAIVRMSALGDIIHTIPAVSLLHKKFPGCRISWIAEPAGARLLENFSVPMEIIPLKIKHSRRRDLFSEIKAFRKKLQKSFDLLIDFQGLIKSAAVCALLGVPSLGFSRENLREPPARLFYRYHAPPIDRSVHVIRQNMALLSPLGIAQGDIKYPMRPIAAGKRLLSFMEKYNLKKGHFVLINIGGGWETKVIGDDKAITLAKALSALIPVVIMAGNPGEMQRAEKISRCSGAPASEIFDFPDLIALLANARMLISGDTLPMHLADAVNTPSLGLFGPTSPARNGSVLTASKALVSPRECRFCYLRKCDKMNCMECISNKEIVRTAQEMLNEFC